MYDKNYYFESDLTINDIRQTHIGRYIKIALAPDYDDSEIAGLVICCNRVSFLGGIDYGGIDSDNLEGVCPDCIKEYHEDLEADEFVKNLQEEMKL